MARPAPAVRAVARDPRLQALPSKFDDRCSDGVETRRSTSSAAHMEGRERDEHTLGSARAPRVPCRAMGYLSLFLLFMLFLLALLPTRRLWVAGARLEWRIGYLAMLIVLGLAAIEFERFGRYLLPILLVLYLAPFSGVATRWKRWNRRPGRETILDGHAVRLDQDDPPRH